jgi:hypothetical protein
MLGLGTAVGLSLMVFAMQQGWPLAPNVPILQGPFGKGEVHDAQVVAVAPGTRGPLASGTYTKGPPAPSGPAETKTSDGDRRAPSGSGLDGSEAVVGGPGSGPSGGGGPAGGGAPGGAPGGDTQQPVTSPQPATNPTPPQGASNGNGRSPITAGVSNPSPEGGGQGGSRIRGPQRSTHERESPPSWSNDERSSHERDEEESSAGDYSPEDSDRGESGGGRSEHER